MAADQRATVMLDVLSGPMTGITSTIAGFSNLTYVMEHFSQNANRMLDGIQGPTMALGALAGALAGKFAMMYGEYERGMKIVGAISGQTQAQMSALGQTAKEFSVKYKIGLDDMNEGLGTLARAGLTDAANQTEVLKNGLQLAKIEGMELGKALEGVIQITSLLGGDMDKSNFGQLSKEVSNLMLATSVSSPLKVQDVIQTLKYSGGLAELGGANLEEENKKILHDYMGTIAEFGKKGVSGDMAGTALRAFLTKPASQDKQVVEGFSQIGMNPGDLWEEGGEKMKPISEQLRLIKDHMKDLSKFEQIDIWGKIVGPKMGQQMMKIDPTDIRKSVSSIESNMNMDSIFSKSMDNFASSWDAMMQQANVNMVNIGQRFALFLKPAVDMITYLLSLLDNPIIAGAAVITGFVLVKNAIKSAIDFVKILKTEFSNFGKDTPKKIAELKDELTASGKAVKTLNILEDAGILTTNQRITLQQALNQELEKEGKIKDKNNTKDKKPSLYNPINEPSKNKTINEEFDKLNKSSPTIDDMTADFNKINNAVQDNIAQTTTLQSKQASITDAVKQQWKHQQDITQEKNKQLKQFKINDFHKVGNVPSEVVSSDQVAYLKMAQKYGTSENQIKKGVEKEAQSYQDLYSHMLRVNKERGKPLINDQMAKWLENVRQLEKEYQRLEKTLTNTEKKQVFSIANNPLQTNKLSNSGQLSQPLQPQYGPYNMPTELIDQAATAQIKKQITDVVAGPQLKKALLEQSKKNNEAGESVKKLTKNIGELSYMANAKSTTLATQNKSIGQGIKNSGFAQGFKQGFDKEAFIDDLGFLLGGQLSMSNVSGTYRDRLMKTGGVPVQGPLKPGDTRKISGGNKLSAASTAFGNAAGSLISTIGVAGIAMAGIQTAVEVYNSALSNYQQTVQKAKDKLSDVQSKNEEVISNIKSEGGDVDQSRERVLEYYKGNIDFDELSDNEKALSANTVALREATQAYKSSLADTNFEPEGWNTKLSTQWSQVASAASGTGLSDITSDYMKSVQGTMKFRTTDPSQSRGTSYESQIIESFLSTDLPTILGSTAYNVMDKGTQQYLKNFITGSEGYSRNIIAILETQKTNLDNIIKEAENLNESGASLDKIEEAVQKGASLVANESGESRDNVMRALFIDMISVYQATGQQVLTELETQLLTNREYYASKMQLDIMKTETDFTYDSMKIQAMQIISGQLAQQIALTEILAQQKIYEALQETTMEDASGKPMYDMWGNPKKWFHDDKGRPISYGDAVQSTYGNNENFNVLNKAGQNFFKNQMGPSLSAYQKTFADALGQDFKSLDPWKHFAGKGEGVGIMAGINALAQYAQPRIFELLKNTNMAKSLDSGAYTGKDHTGKAGTGDKSKSTKDSGSGKIFANVALCKKKLIPNLNVNLFKKPPSFLINNKNLKIGDIKVNTEDKPKTITNAVKNAVIDIQNQTNPKIIQDETGVYDPTGATDGQPLPSGSRATT